MTQYRALVKQTLKSFNKGHFRNYLLTFYRHNKNIQQPYLFIRKWISLLKSISQQSALYQIKGINQIKSHHEPRVILGYKGFKFDQGKWNDQLINNSEKKELLDLWMICQLDYFCWRNQNDYKKIPIFPKMKGYGFLRFNSDVNKNDISLELPSFGIKINFLKKTA